jgi:hypothetical protein
MAQAVETLLCKHEALHKKKKNPVPSKKKKYHRLYVTKRTDIYLFFSQLRDRKRERETERERERERER